MLIETIQPFVIALAIGLLIGIERERSHPPGMKAIGLRTFILLSLLGAITAWLKEPLVAWAITFFVAIAVMLSYMRVTRHQRNRSGLGITTEVAAMVTFGLGYMARRDPLMTLIISVVVLIVLLARKALHRFSREQVRPAELQATAVILILALGVLPFLPDQTIDPWSLFNPRRFAILVLVIAFMQFSAYLLMRMFGARRGLLFTGLLTGFVSSTIATASFSQQVKRGLLPPTIAAVAIIYATVSMFISFLVVIAIVAPDLLRLASWPIFAAVLVSMVMATWVTKRNAIDKKFPEPENPLALWAAIRLAALILFMLLIVSVAQRYFGTTGMHAVSFLGGLFDLHGVTFAISTLHRENEIILRQTMLGLGFAITATFVSKIIMICILGRLRFIVTSISMLLVVLFVTLFVWGLVLQV